MKLRPVNTQIIMLHKHKLASNFHSVKSNIQPRQLCQWKLQALNFEALQFHC